MAEPPRLPGRAAPLPPSQTPPRPYALEPYHPDRIRGGLAFRLTWRVIGTIAFIMVQVARGYWEQTREFAEIVLPLDGTLLGSALTFFFARREP